MAFAPPSKTKFSSNLAKSTWTPMNHPEANQQVFKERREIIQKWFQKWQDSQKEIIVNDILKNLSQKHLVSLHETLNEKFPQEKYDFTRILPRVLTLYLFSFLDPRTLCRCSQVSWYWNYLTEMDCLWRPKCLRFGWYPTYQPSPFEEKIWKRFYVNTVHDLNFTKIKSEEAAKQNFEEESRPDTARSNISRYSLAKSTSSSITGLKKGPTIPSTKKPLSAPKWQPPPWKGSDPHPADTTRYNYLNNIAGNKKKSASPTSRPSSKQGRRQPSAGRHRNSIQETSLSSSRIISHDPNQGKASYDPSLNKASRFSGSTLANFASGGTIPSPRLNKHFELPSYNGHSSTTIGVSSTINSTLQYTTGNPAVNNKINRIPQTSSSFSTNQLPFDKMPPSQFSSNNPVERSKMTSLSANEIASLSLDAGVRPRPVAQFNPNRTKQNKENTLAEKSASEKVVPAQKGESLPASNADDLKGKGWEAPNHSNSDDDF